MILSSVFKTLDQTGQSFLTFVALVAFLGIATSISYVAFSPIESTDNLAETRLKIEKLQQAIIIYRGDNGGSAPSGLADLMTSPGGGCSVDTNPSSSTYRQKQGWCGPYLDQVFRQKGIDYQTDGWGTVFLYNGSVIRSCGSNRICNDGDDIFESI